MQLNNEKYIKLIEKCKNMIDLNLDKNGSIKENISDIYNLQKKKIQFVPFYINKSFNSESNKPNKPNKQIKQIEQIEQIESNKNIELDKQNKQLQEGNTILLQTVTKLDSQNKELINILNQLVDKFKINLSKMPSDKEINRLENILGL